METGTERPTELVYTLSRLQWLSGWWSWALAILLVSGCLYLVVKLYRRDTVELARATKLTLIGLRVALIAGLVFFLLGLERRARQRVTRPSEVAVLVDTSQSMSLPESDQPGGRSRIEAAQELVAQTPLIESMAQNHRVTVYTFDTTGDLNEVLVSSVGDAGTDDDATTTPANLSDSESDGTRRSVKSLAIIGAIGLATSLLLMVLAGALAVMRVQRAVPPLLLASALSMIVGGGLLGATWTMHTDVSLAGLLGLGDGASDASQANDQTNSTQADDSNANDGSDESSSMTLAERMRAIDWQSILVASGSETRIGDALRGVSARHDPTTLAGVMLLSDGENNGGTPPLAASALFSRGGTAIYPIGLGSAKAPTNVRIVDLDAPRRVYPGDRFALNAVLQASSEKPVTVQVQLLDRQDDGNLESNTASDVGSDSNGSETGEVVDSREVEIPGDGTLTGVRFEMEPAAVGKRILTVRVVPPQGDQNEKDNVRQARYEVVSKRLRVMLIAGGPMREYQFVRNLMFREKSVELDVWLQTGQAGMSQDADKLLTGFPATANELFEYDAIVAFDPDWLMMDASDLELLDQWLSRQAGGLALISGPVYMPEWMRLRTDPRIDIVRQFFPVVLSRRGPLLSSGRTGGDNAWKLEFTPDGTGIEFLNIGNDAEAWNLPWKDFDGVYDYLGVYEAKPGAKVYAYFQDPSAAVDDRLPIYLASQFYGAGRVFFQGSGEMWRLRGMGDELFDAYYTKLVRWISEGRLLRDSNRGLLLVDKPRAMVGDTITVRAILTDEQFQPLKVSQVEAKLLTPGGRVETVRLTPLAGEPREGTYSARILAREAGAYELRVTLGSALDEEVLSQGFQVGLPTLELERPQRNDEVLRALAASTGGQYITMDGSTSTAGAGPLDIVQQIEPQPQLTILPGTPDKSFETRRNATLMWLLCSMLTMEWVIRRLHRLA